MDSFSLFVFNVFINSFLAFFTASLLIEMVLFLFRIRPGKWAAMLRMIPLLKLPFDMFAYDFSNWSYLHGVNPLFCEEGSRTLQLVVGKIGTNPIFTSGIQFFVPGDLKFTLADVLGYFCHPVFLMAFSAFLIGSSCFSFGRKIRAYVRCNRMIEALPVGSIEGKGVRNAKLRDHMEQKGISVARVSGVGGSPFVAGFLSNVIYMPRSLEGQLSQNEYDAVIAHEVEHLRRKDTLIRGVLDLIGAIFWWIPTGWLRRRIEEGQEVACDLNSERYQVASLDLASAIYTSAKASSRGSMYNEAHCLSKHIVQKRVCILLQDKRYGVLHTVWALCVALFAFLAVFMGRFWVF